jgi:hypothetical protein
VTPSKTFECEALPDSRQPTEPEIAAIAEKKRERSILLQSAGTDLTTKFKQWWKQGNYRFRFEADGDHFRIWVSDDRRPEEIELESRSTGLQWFLSFYLVFLVESQGGAHQSAILLLDESGLSLHPLAQRDLAEFFNGLATFYIFTSLRDMFLRRPEPTSADSAMACARSRELPRKASKKFACTPGGMGDGQQISRS